MKKKLLLTFLLIICSFFTLNKLAEAKKTTTITIKSQDEWVQAVKDWTDLMLKDGDWIYSNKDNKTYWKDARKANPPRTNCALMIVHALQRFGVFDTNHKVYSSDKHELIYSSASKKRLYEIADIYKYDGVKHGTIDLQPGDILFYNKHMNVYGGKKDGKRFYYDAGRGTNIGNVEGKTWKSFINYKEDHDIYGIIRLKYGETVHVDGEVADSKDDDENDDPEGGSTSDPEVIAPSLQTGELNCDTLFLNSDGSEKEFKKILDTIFGLIQIAAPVIAIALTIVDYIKVIASDGNSKKANIRTAKRIVIAVLIVFLPMLLNLLFHMFGLFDLSSCNIGG